MCVDVVCVQHIKPHTLFRLLLYQFWAAIYAQLKFSEYLLSLPLSFSHFLRSFVSSISPTISLLIYLKKNYLALAISLPLNPPHLFSAFNCCCVFIITYTKFAISSSRNGTQPESNRATTWFGWLIIDTRKPFSSLIFIRILHELINDTDSKRILLVLITVILLPWRLEIGKKSSKQLLHTWAWFTEKNCYRIHFGSCI